MGVAATRRAGRIESHSVLNSRLRIMEIPLESSSVGVGLSPLFDLGVSIGIILLLGWFLWNKGHLSITSKR